MQFKKWGYDDAVYDAGRRMGKNTIGGFSKYIHNKVKFPKSENFSNHCWRAWMISKLTASAGVNSLDVMEFGRHQNATSQLPYVRKGSNSCRNFQNALQCVKLPSKPTADMFEEENEVPAKVNKKKKPEIPRGTRKSSRLAGLKKK